MTPISATDHSPTTRAPRKRIFLDVIRGRLYSKRLVALAIWRRDGRARVVAIDQPRKIRAARTMPDRYGYPPVKTENFANIGAAVLNMSSYSSMIKNAMEINNEHLSELEPIRDEYQVHRGGYSTMLLISCGRCLMAQFIYQKDGPGPLLRCYANRIRVPEWITDVFDLTMRIPASEQAPLRCECCEHLLGRPIEYKDGRLAFELPEGAVRAEVLAPTLSITF